METRASSSGTQRLGLSRTRTFPATASKVSSDCPSGGGTNSRSPKISRSNLATSRWASGPQLLPTARRQPTPPSKPRQPALGSRRRVDGAAERDDQRRGLLVHMLEQRGDAVGKEDRPCHRPAMLDDW
mmetsp:Transcript_33269/g.106818  ORF Transcript_33269/g.106818 Transcript_33269/m.106818 type:complete len:128 (-) Transcript_33269:542-925(-)